METAATNSEIVGILTLLACGLGSVAITFIAVVIHDLRDRIMRIENHLFGDPVESGPVKFRKVGAKQ